MIFMESLEQRLFMSAVPILHSNPDAVQKIFLDFDGHTVINTYWNSRNDGKPIHAQAYDTDGNIFSFSSTELSNIKKIWERVSEDYVPFNVDVTTEDPGEALFKAGKKAIRALISTDVDSVALGGTGKRWYSGAGGTAYTGSWTWTSNTPVWAFENMLGNGNEKYTAEAISHEVGHSFGLKHDGNSSTSYYSGHGTGDTGWAPIMGIGYYKTLTQWSKGEYPNANNKQDDISVIASTTNNVALRVDDHGNSNNASSQLLYSSNVVTGNGFITTSADVDVFGFYTGAGQISLNIDPLVRGPNLDILAKLYDSNGTLVATNNPASYLYADINVSLSQGTYYLHVDGTGKGDLTTGYSDYGSLGKYSITGTVVLSSTLSMMASIEESESVRWNEIFDDIELLSDKHSNAKKEI